MERLLDRIRAQSYDLGTKLRLSRSRRHEHTGQAETTHSNSHTIHKPLQYDPLCRDRTIRVIDLAPGTWDEPVTCFLRTVHLDDDDLRYEAISYAWGDPNDRKTLICNGYVVSTTRSLFEALQRFRYADTPRTLWADALCINQANSDERTLQVRLMSFIYTRAARVLVWLQHEGNQVVQDSLNAICRYLIRSDGFAKYPQISNYHQNSQMLYKWRGVTVTSVIGDDPSDPDLAAMNALHHICNSTWFSRGWVIQEVALGTSASVFWGHAEIGFEWLGVAAARGILSASYGFSSGMLHCYWLFQLCPLSEAFGSMRMSCFDLLASTVYVTFSDPKDRIYGLLGLKTIEHDPADGRLLVDPDYSITPMECYRRVASKLLLEWHDFRVLSWAGHRFGLTEDWPSWVPDWTRLQGELLGPADDEDWNMSKGSSTTHILETIENGNHCIAISGFTVDAVDREVKEYRDLGDLKDDAYGPARLQAMLRSLARLYSQECLACTFGNRYKWLSLSFTRTANLLSEYHIFTGRNFKKHKYEHQHGSVLWRKDYDPSFVPSADVFLARCRRDRDGHTLFITSTGMLALGPIKTLPGDVVVVLHGNPIPFVLRPASDGLWRLVGECYVYDVNEGRIHREWEENGSVSEKFCIY